MILTLQIILWLFAVVAFIVFFIGFYIYKKPSSGCGGYINGGILIFCVKVFIVCAFVAMVAGIFLYNVS